MKRTLIKNALIIDGSGEPRFTGHILIEGQAIAEVLEAGREALPGHGAVFLTAVPAIPPD